MIADELISVEHPWPAEKTEWDCAWVLRIMRIEHPKLAVPEMFAIFHPERRVAREGQNQQEACSPRQPDNPCEARDNEFISRATNTFDKFNQPHQSLAFPARYADVYKYNQKFNCCMHPGHTNPS